MLAESSCGSETSSSCRTVSPPTPESKTPIGRARVASGGGAGTAPMVGAVSGGRRVPPRGVRRDGPRGRAACALLADLVDRGLQRVRDLLGDAQALGAV